MIFVCHEKAADFDSERSCCAARQMRVIRARFTAADPKPLQAASIKSSFPILRFTWKEAFGAKRQNQVESSLSPLKLGGPLKTCRKVSCLTSSTSWAVSRDAKGEVEHAEGVPLDKSVEIHRSGNQRKLYTGGPR
jgi:hypothetical protein